MFTLDQIKTAHSKVKSGADFPAFVQELIQLGVVGYQTYVSDGHTEFSGNDPYLIQSEPKYAILEVADKSNRDQFTHDLKEHQQGKSDYLTFCRQSAGNGVEKWIVNMQAMTCTYYDKEGNKMLEEKIPN